MYKKLRHKQKQCCKSTNTSTIRNVSYRCSYHCREVIRMRVRFLGTRRERRSFCAVASFKIISTVLSPTPLALVVVLASLEAEERSGHDEHAEETVVHWLIRLTTFSSPLRILVKAQHTRFLITFRV